MSLFKKYESFLLSNAAQITAIESSLRSLTYFLPGRFKDAELAGEALFAALNLLGLYHDSILVRLLSSRPSPSPLPTPVPTPYPPSSPFLPARSASSSGKARSATPPPPYSYLPSPHSHSLTGGPLHHSPSPHARYTHHWSDRSPTYNVAARALVVIGYTELLVEMIARRRARGKGKKGEDDAWKVVVAIETVKAALRLLLVHLTSHRPLIQPPIPEREVDPAMLEEERKRAMEAAFAPSAAVSEGNSALAEGARERERPGSMNGLFARPGAYAESNGEVVATNGVDSASGTAETPAATASSEGSPHLWPMGSSKDYWCGARTGLIRPTLASLSNGDGDGRTTSAVPSPASRQNGGLATEGGGDGSDGTASAEGGVDATAKRLRLSDEKIRTFLLSRTLYPTDVKRPEELVDRLERWGRVAEVLWIVRPLIYVMLIRKYGRRSKMPFLLSLGLEYVARSLRLRSQLFPSSSKSSSASSRGTPLMLALVSGLSGGGLLGGLSALAGEGSAWKKRPASEVESDEWARRDRSFWWYLLRGPVWHDFTKPNVQSVVGALENKPLLGVFASILKDYLPLVDDYYYYTAT